MIANLITLIRNLNKYFSGQPVCVQEILRIKGAPKIFDILDTYQH